MSDSKGTLRLQALTVVSVLLYATRSRTVVPRKKRRRMIADGFIHPD